MDGGGRLLEPLAAGAAGGAVYGSAPAWAGAARLPHVPLRLPGLSRRRSVSVPLGRRLPRLLGTGLTLAFFAGVGLTGAVVGGQYRAFVAEFGEPHHVAARVLGLGLDRVTISGLSQLTETEVLNGAGISHRASLAFLDVAEVRERLERLPLVRSASVRKLYPHELVVTLEERKPHALWQRNGELFVIAADGTVIDLMEDARFADLPFVVGDDANGRTKDYLALIEAAGALKPRIKAGSLVSGRRWTLKMDNGIDVRLPEIGAAEALARLARLEREQRILDKDVLAIDMRLPDRVVVRLTEEAVAARSEAMRKKPTRGKGVDT